jgi:hypothetical protein
MVMRSRSKMVLIWMLLGTAVLSVPAMHLDVGTVVPVRIFVTTEDGEPLVDAAFESQNAPLREREGHELRTNGVGIVHANIPAYGYADVAVLWRLNHQSHGPFEIRARTVNGAEYAVAVVGFKESYVTVLGWRPLRRDYIELTGLATLNSALKRSAGLGWPRTPAVPGR